MTDYRCGKCHEIKDESDFSPSRLLKTYKLCRVCTNAYRSTPEQRKSRTKQTRDWRRANGAVPRKDRKIDERGQECAECDSYKLWEHFYDDKTNLKVGKRATCIVCVMEKQTARLLKKNFQISIEQYNYMLEQQNGVCFLCHEKETRISFGSESPDRLAVDHWHGCQEGHSPKNGCPKCIRGLLCASCNRGIGCFEDKPRLAGLFQHYLRRRPLA